MKETLLPATNLVDRATSSAMRILYVEDSIAQSKLLLDQLAAHGLSADWFANAEEALLAIEKANYALVLTDINLGAGMDGGEFARQIRGMGGRWGTVPIVALTASSDARQRGELFKIGINDYVSKPVLEEELMARIGHLLERQNLLAQLAEYQIGLESTIEARTRELRRTQDHLQATLDAIPDLLFELDLDGRYQSHQSLQANHLAAAPEFIMGTTVSETLPPDAAEIVLAALRDAHAYGRSMGKQFELLLPQGRRHFELSVSRRTDELNHAPRFVVLARNITDRKAAEERASRMASLYATLSLCSQAIIHSPSELELFDEICRVVVESGGLAMAWIGAIDSATRTICPIARFGHGIEYLNNIQLSIDGDSPLGRGPTGIAIRQRHPYWCQSFDDPAIAPWRELRIQTGFASSASLPLFKDHKVMGALSLYARPANFFDETARNLLQEIASDISFALDKYSLEEQREQSIHALKDSEFSARLAAENARAALASLQHQKYALDQHSIVATTNARGEITYANEKFSAISGYSMDELMGRDHGILNSGVHPKGFFKAMYQTLASGNVWHDEVCNRAKDGHLYWVDTTIVPFLDKDGKPEQYIAIRTDISERKLAELEKQKTEEFIRKIAAQAPGCLYQFKMLADGSFCVPYASAGLRDLYGIDPEDVRKDATKIFSSIHPDDIDGFVNSIKASAQNMALWNHEYRLRLEDGATRWISGNAAPQRDAADSVLWHGYISDITRQKQVENLLRENEHSLNETQRIAHIGWYVTDISSSVWTSSPILDEIFGIDSSYVKTIETWGKLLVPEFQQEMTDYYRRCVAERSKFHAEYQIIRQNDGQLRWVAAYGEFIFDPEGRPVTLKGAIQDITERKISELELQHYRSHLETLVEQKTIDLQKINASFQEAERIAHLGNWQLDLAKGKLAWSDEVFRLFEIDRSQVDPTYETFLNAIHPDDRDAVNQAFAQSIETRTPYEISHRLRMPDGRIKWVYEEGSSVFDAAGTLVRSRGIVQDITARRQAEEAAHAANRAKSEFLANMSHEIRTPMNGVIGMVDILQTTELKPEQQRMLETIHRSSLALLNILNDILDYSKIEAGKLAIEQIPTHLRETTEGVAQLMATAAGAKSVELSVFVSPELPVWIVSDPTRLRQVLLNLLGNAVKFTETREGHRGCVAVCAEPCRLIDGSPGLELRVRDNGIGMSPEALAKLFQPFSQGDESTARKFGGTGLGLSICQRLVTMMNGHITARSTLGVGSEFTVEFPLQASTAGRVLEPETSLAGIHVLAVTRDEFAMKILPAYCRAAGAQISLLPDLVAARQALRHTPSSTATVLLLGLDISTASDELDVPTNVRVVRMIDRKQTPPPAAICIAVRPLLYHDLLRGIALAGRRSTNSGADRIEHRSPTRNPVPNVEQEILTARPILLAEDNETNREVMREQLRLLGYAAETAEDGVVALRMWRSGRYAMLLTDCHMPNMDGFELTAAIRQDELAAAQGQHSPIVAVTANAMQGEAQRCLERGMDDYLSKPLRLNELGPMLAKWLPLIGPSPMPEEVTLEPVENGKLATWDAMTLTTLVGDNPSMHFRLLEKFLLNAQEQVLGIIDAAKRDGTDSVATLAHKLKSSARTVGALALGELCQEMESAGRAGDHHACQALVAAFDAEFMATTKQIRAAMATAVAQKVGAGDTARPGLE